MRTSVLVLLFLPAHVAFALLVDLDFIPDASGPATLVRTEVRGPTKERQRLHLLRQSEIRSAIAAVRETVPVRDLDPWSLSPRSPAISSAGESVSVKLTTPAAIELWLTATPHNYRAPPA